MIWILFIITIFAWGLTRYMMRRVKDRRRAEHEKRTERLGRTLQQLQHKENPDSQHP